MVSAEMTALAAAALRLGTEPERVLEIGCGDGDATLFLAREFPRASVRGVDPSEEAVRRAAGRVGLDPEGRVAFKAASGRRLPFPDDHFDLVVRAGPPDRLREAERVLRPGGHLISFGSGPPRDGRLRQRWRERRLSRLGFELLQEGGAGGGSFSVFRLAAAGRDSPSD